MMRTRARPALLAYFTITALASAAAQTRDLAQDISELHIRHETDHYALAGTVSDKRMTEYGRCLEYIYKEYTAGFGELLDERSERKKPESTNKGDAESSRPGNVIRRDGQVAAPGGRFPVVVLATDAQYKEFTAAYFGARGEHTRGMFVPSVKLLIIRDEVASQETYDVLFHEAFHQFVDRHMPYAPTWINEGLATYYGTARPTRKGLVFDRPRLAYYQVVRDARDAHKLIPLHKLMAYGASAFYSPKPIEGIAHNRMTLCYAESYTLVAFLLSSPPGRQHLRRYLKALARAQTDDEAADATQVAFGDHAGPRFLDRITAGWLKSIKRP